MNAYAKLLDALIDKYDFYKVFFQYPYPADYYPLDDECELYFGATRGCLVLPNMPTVVKFDVDRDGMDESVCAREVATFNKAKENHLEGMFASAKYIGTYIRTIHYWKWDVVREVVGVECDEDEDYWSEVIAENLSEEDKVDITIRIPLYEYEKAEEHDFHPSDESCKKLECNKVFAYPTVGAQFMDTYGEVMFRAIEKFCEDNGINDLHLGNVGFIRGKIVFIDYAGYYTKGSSNDEED